MEEKIIMTKKEVERFKIINDLIDKKINGTQTSKKLNLTLRHIKRLKNKVIKEGLKGLVNKNRGRVSNRKISIDLENKLKEIIKEKYADFTTSLIQEKLEEENIKISYSVIKRIKIENNLYKPRKRKNNQYYSQRTRKEYFGELQQFDGSYHDWFEGRNEEKEQCLLLSIDDATGKLTHAKFDKNESIRCVFKFWKEYVNKNKKPLAIYLDKFSTYKVNHKNAVDNKDLITQFQRAMQELDIKTIQANSPQAKGRVERSFQTLQDRLVKEMRLKNICKIKEANEFLEKEFIPNFNKKFAIKPFKKDDLHKELQENEKETLDNIFSIKEQRKVKNDYVVQYKNRYFQLEEIQKTTIFKKDSITIEEHLDKKILIQKNNKYLNFFELKEKPIKELNMNLIAITTHKSNYIPPASHPWRKTFKN